MRFPLLLATIGSVMAASSAHAASIPTTPLPACGGAVTSRCVESISVNGTPVVYPTDPTVGSGPYDVYAVRYTLDGAKYFHVDVDGDTAAMSTADEWDIVLNTGEVFPGETEERGQDVRVNRGMSGGSHTVRFRMKPVRIAYDGCTSAGACGAVAALLDPAALSATVDDLGYYTDPDDAAAARGFDFAFNTDWASKPLQFDWATNTIRLDVANAHFEPDGTTVVKGRAEFRLPNAMLTRFYNVDDPASLTPAAFVVTGSGGSATTSVVVEPGSVHVDIANMTFSKRKLRIQGRTYPRKPGNLRTIRKSGAKAVIKSSGARPRGSKIRGYKAVCRPGRGTTVKAQTTRRNPLPIRVRGLAPGKRYVCTVRAKSRAGLGTKGTTRIPRTP